MFDWSRSRLTRPIVTLVVAVAVFWGSLFVPSHATAMAFGTAIVTSDDHTKPPCPMSMLQDAHAEHTGGMTLSDGDEAKRMAGDMPCCPALALSPSNRFGDVLWIVGDVPLEISVLKTNRFSVPGVEPRPPRS